MGAGDNAVTTFIEFRIFEKYAVKIVVDWSLMCRGSLCTVKKRNSVCEVGFLNEVIRTFQSISRVLESSRGLSMIGCRKLSI